MTDFVYASLKMFSKSQQKYEKCMVDEWKIMWFTGKKVTSEHSLTNRSPLYETDYAIRN